MVILTTLAILHHPATTAGTSISTLIKPWIYISSYCKFHLLLCLLYWILICAMQCVGAAQCSTSGHSASCFSSHMFLNPYSTMGPYTMQTLLQSVSRVRKYIKLSILIVHVPVLWNIYLSTQRLSHNIDFITTMQ